MIRALPYFSVIFEADYKIHGFEDLRLHMNLSGEYADGGEYTNNNPYSTYGFYYGGVGENKEKKYNLIATHTPSTTKISTRHIIWM